ncbi:hypothetical protein [Thiomicrospira sp. ALE5]|uniref:hypothetical protein n=1 Tax=Thiomicrospira sp. ALE5 TaxID=748650 RepID=UPI001F1B15A2|nr:hypothetical protein [Thiomicrospira sp. ALE5]
MAFPLPHPAIAEPIEQVSWLISAYPDASHQLLYLQTAHAAYYLKWPKKQVKHQIFWRISQAWLALEPHTNYQTNYQTTASSKSIWSQLASLTPLHWIEPLDVSPVTRPIASSTARLYLLTPALANEGAPENLSKQTLAKLRAHYQAMQGLTRSQFGSLVDPLFAIEQWYGRLKNCLEATNLPVHLVTAALVKAVDYPETACVPLMLDWRWDQLTWQQGLPDTIIDLDAWIWAPDTLNWVMLEYLLAEQSAADISCWVRDLNVDQVQLNAWRDAYRLLLFAMNWQGATDLQAWLNAPRLFQC